MRIYRLKAFERLPPYCAVCDSLKNLQVHHKDENRRNDSIYNLLIVCEKCHRKIHNMGKPRTCRQQKGNPKFMKGTRRKWKK